MEIELAIKEMFEINPTSLPEPNDDMICSCVKCNCEKGNCNCIMNISLTQNLLATIKLRNSAYNNDIELLNNSSQKIANLLHLHKKSFIYQ